MSNEASNNKKSWLREKGLELIIGLLVALASVFIIQRLDKIDDNQVSIIEQQAINTTEISNVKDIVEGLSETQGTVQGTAGDNSFDIAFIKRDIKDLEERIEELEEEE
jgi:hypothetical protein